ncbi:hypothetical protein [Halosegnis marinus]|uniref:CARDB domain-containing protein n=1 Tax=Halosegnis marinus TaxID=3034023 RepID=A0ABD5ZSF2_9EURY|nr:hypothetical protein [Halosegnis sp. DT85]
MRRLLVVALVAALVVPAGIGLGTSSAPKPSVVSVEVSPEPAVVGETVTVAPTIRNDATASEDFNVSYVSLRTTEGDQLRRYTNITDLGTLSPGTSVRVPFDVTFDAAGQKRLRVVVVGQNATGNETRVEYPVSFSVRSDHPAVRLDVEETLTAGVAEPVNVTVSNGFERELRSVSVEVTGDGVRTDPATVGAARLGAGEERAFGLDLRAASPGSVPVEVTVEYRTTTGLERETTVTRTLDFETLSEDVTVNAGSPERGNTTVPVTVGNFGNAPLENVVVRATASNGSVAPVAVGSLDAGTTRTVALDVTDVESRADVDVTVSYRLAGETRSVSDSTRVVADRDVPGDVELTGLDTEREGDRVHVLGSAANVGLRGVDSVIVRVLPADGVEPAAPNREYFVGTVPASDFVSFDVYATVEGNVSEIPLEVSYLADGERRTYTTSVPYEAPAEPSGNTNDGGGNGLLVVGAGVVLALLVVGLLVVGWRSRGE